LAKKHGIFFDKRWCQARVGIGVVAGQHVVLAKPQTFVNVSGHSVGPLKARLRLETSHLLVIYDDVALPLGRMRVRAQGSAGGHNGMRSIIQRLGTDQFVRLRLGIGPPEVGRDTKDYVLGDFGPEERAAMEEAYDKACEAVEILLSEGIEVAMNRYNG
jgi:PTH1 family peptidyl-tRNA hydrolase